MKSFLQIIASLVCLAALTACGGGSGSTPSANQPTSLSVVDTVAGTGAAAVAGKSITVTYTGWVYDANAAMFHGGQFDTSVGRSPPSFTLVLGAGSVIAGWDQGVLGMKVGGKRTLIIPAGLAYGSSANGAIPANSGLVFDIALLSVN